MAENKKEIEKEIRDCTICDTAYPNHICSYHKAKLEGYQQATKELLDDEIKFLDKINFNELLPKDIGKPFDLDIIQVKLIKERIKELKEKLKEQHGRK